MLLQIDAVNGLKKLPNESVDLIYLDPPYGTGRDFKFLDKLAFTDKYTQQELLSLLEPIFDESYRVLSESGSFFLHGDFRFIHKAKCLLDYVFNKRLVNEIIWSYNSGGGSKRKLGNKHDTILWYSKSGDYTFNAPRENYSESAPRGYEKEHYYHPDGKVASDVWTIPVIAQNQKKIDGWTRKRYPTEKPKILLERIISMGTNVGNIVCDPMFGSGVTLKAAKDLGRSYIGFDISDVAVEIATQRLG